jgi:hypothetical protein
MLFGEDLAPYFDIDNLIFKGYTKEQYRRTGQLPEGFYRITVEVRHFHTGRLISNQGIVMAWFALGKPPVLKLPENNAELGQIAGMPLTFTWQGNSPGIPGVNVQYRFELWEMRIDGIDPNVVTVSLPCVYSTTQFHNTLVVQPEALMLEPGMKYAWRVTASDVMNRTSFENDGKSEVRTFTYLCKCDEITDLKVERRDKNAHFSWQAFQNHTSFNVEAENTETGYHKSYTVYDNRYTLPGLDYGVKYRLRVQGVCNNGMRTSAFSEWKDITMPVLLTQKEICPECECRDPEPEPELKNKTLKTDLQVGDTIYKPSGMSEYVITSITENNNGTYKGQCDFLVRIWGVRILLNFWNLQVNTDRRILRMGGENVKTDGFVADADEINNAVNTLTETNDNTNISVDFTIPENPQITFNDSDSTLTITDSDGNPHTIELPKDSEGKIAGAPITILDVAGNSFVVDENGNVTILATADSNAANSDSTTVNSKNECYYSIEGHKFYSGSTIYLPVSNKRYEIKAYRDDVNLFKRGTVWDGITAADSAIAHYTPRAASSNINGTAISTIYSDSLIYDTLQCKIVVVNVEFEEDPNQKWGFDENDLTTENDYPSFRTNPVYGIKWKSIKADGTPDNIIVNVMPTGAEKAIEFIASNPGFQVNSFIPTGNSKYRLSVSTTSDTETSLMLKIGYFMSDTIQIKLYGMKENNTNDNKNKIRITIVHESNDDVQIVQIGDIVATDTTRVISSGNNRFLDSRRGIDICGDDMVLYDVATGDSIVVAGANKICESRAYNTDVRTMLISMPQLQDTLNKYYSQSVYKWEVIGIEERIVNFDLNRDGKIDVESWLSSEMKSIVDNCIMDTTIFNIIVVDNPNDGSNGYSEFPDKNTKRLAFVHPQNSPNIYLTICHELGHGAFKLKHPFNEFSGFPKGGKDIFNIMNYGTKRNRFRKYQWEKIK